MTQVMKLLSVTRAIKLNGLIESDWVTQEGLDMGTEFHKARHVIDSHPRGVNLATVDPRVHGDVESYLKWKAQVRPDVVLSEEEFVCEALGLTGHPDFFAIIDGRLWIIDTKRGTKQSWHPYQTALYAILYCAKYPGEPTPKRANLYMNREGKLPKFEEHADWRDFNRAKALVTVAYIHLENGKEMPQ